MNKREMYIDYSKKDSEEVAITILFDKNNAIHCRSATLLDFWIIWLRDKKGLDENGNARNVTNALD